MLIPIRNVWLLQLFASQLYRSAGTSLVAAEENPEDLPALVARILADEVERRLHTGLTVGFHTTSRPVTRVRGRINALTTERGQLLRRGLISCTFDEIVADIPSNRLVRVALQRAATLVPREPRYRSLALQLEAAGVRGQPPPMSYLPTMQRQRLLARDRLMLAAAELVLTLSIPTTDDGVKMLPLPSLDEGYLRRLFERAAYGIYAHKLQPDGWTVSPSQRQRWQVEHASPGMTAILPTMELDIVLQAPKTDAALPRRLVIDTKFTSVTKPTRHLDARVDSNYLYQIYAYLRSQETPDDRLASEGLLLHPSVGIHVDEEAVIQGHRIRFATVDLMARPGDFADEFLAAITPARHRADDRSI